MHLPNVNEHNCPLDVITALYQLVWNYGAGDITAIDLSAQTVRTKLQYGEKLYHFTVSVTTDKIVVKMRGHQRTIKL